MNYAEWINTVKPQLTPKGARLDLRLYIYPDGHGNISLRTTDMPDQPVNDAQEASRVFLELWDKAVHARSVKSDQTDDESDLAVLLDQITPENIHREVDSGSAVGHEAW